jgi:hypothetical protein
LIRFHFRAKLSEENNPTTLVGFWLDTRGKAGRLHFETGANLHPDKPRTLEKTSHDNI